MAVHAYVFMTNHIHLLVSALTAKGISEAMHSADRAYSGYFNARYERTGTLWEGRFHANAVETDYYLFACHRYIDMNPVRAQMVPHPDRYPWSSHRYHALGVGDSLVTPHPLITAMSEDDFGRRVAYQGLFDKATCGKDWDLIRAACRRGIALGDDTETKLLGHRGRPKKTRT